MKVAPFRLAAAAAGAGLFLAARGPALAEPAPSATAAEPAEDGDAQALTERISDLEEDLRQTRRWALARRSPVLLSGYADVGFYAPEGTGVGFVQDGLAGAPRFPEHAGRFGWVFLGDILAPAINTRGEPADLGDPPGAARFDTIDSNGAPGFIVNEVNLRVSGAVADSALATASINFTPRSGTGFRFGDVFDVDLAQLEWMVGPRRRLSLFVGKMDPVIGIEYRERKADRRFGITPSLIARYTTGTPLGLKARLKLGPGERVVLAGALTNGSSVIEPFHFYDELDSNAAKTASGRLSASPALPFELELGVSSAYGAQDRALDSRGALWFVGADVRARVGAWQLKAEWLRGRGEGESGWRHAEPHRPYGLRLHDGGYVTVEGTLTPTLGLLVRGELRDAEVWLGDPTAASGADRLYVTRSWRATLGVRAALTDRLIVKAEYLRNGEYGRVPSIPNDVFTSSLVAIF